MNTEYHVDEGSRLISGGSKMEGPMDYYRILSAISDLYVSLFYYDLNDDTLEGIKSNRFIDMWSAEYEGARDKTLNVIKNITVEQELDGMMEFADIGTLNERMSDRRILKREFEGKINGLCRAIFVEVDRNIDRTLHHVLFLVECIAEN